MKTFEIIKIILYAICFVLYLISGVYSHRPIDFIVSAIWFSGIILSIATYLIRKKNEPSDVIDLKKY